MLAAVGVGRWALVSHSPPSPHPLSSWPRRTCEPPYEQMLVDVGRVLTLSPPLPLPRPPASLPLPTVSLTSRWGWVVLSPSAVLRLPVVPVHPPLIHPASSCSQRWWCHWRGWWLLWTRGRMLRRPPSLLCLVSGQCQVYLTGLPMSPLRGVDV